LPAAKRALSDADLGSPGTVICLTRPCMRFPEKDRITQSFLCRGLWTAGADHESTHIRDSSGATAQWFRVSMERVTVLLHLRAKRTGQVERRWVLRQHLDGLQVLMLLLETLTGADSLCLPSANLKLNSSVGHEGRDGNGNRTHSRGKNAL
jgi:hypothetical protein